MPKVYASINRPPRDLVAQVHGLRLDQIVKALPTAQLMDSAIEPLGLRNVRVVGPAVTVASVGPDPMLGMIATGVAQPGDVIVVAAGGSTAGFAWGGGLTLSAANVGCAGVVVDGVVIDADSIVEQSLPVFCRGATLRSTPVQARGSVNVAVTCGGVLIEPGDVIVGTLDGVCVIPRGDVADLIAAVGPESARINANIETLKATRQTIFDLRGGRRLADDLGLEWID
ncbi:MAG: 4-hydroxy-4-methyl-2-oxoglutarate aldolase [Proteobacteria bacterium]|nr:4-hydroxy-4-methyl-2-oxoglutarate aldolase [Pseudomonadota bacterium]MDA1058855.1 4-hydroxy-4-methyl-2-oxoglutarate aldolase [Pseudomonadota bacterium]